MRKNELYDYIRENFSLNGTSQRLIYDALDYIKTQNTTCISEEISAIYSLVGSIGISESEIGAFVLPKAEIEDIRASFEPDYDGPDICAVDGDADFLIHENGYTLKQCEDLYQKGALFNFDCTEQELEDWKNNTYSNNYER